MNLIFMGTPDFAVPCLQALVENGHNVLAVFSQPDKPKGRGHKLTSPPVKECAERFGIPVYQPNTLRDGKVLKMIDGLNADLIVVVAYGKILPKEMLVCAKHGCINVHGSLLPKYRGAAPIQWAVLNGEKETGVTIMQMDEGLDTGDMLLVKKTEIGENESSAQLFDRLSVLGSDALIEALPLIENGKIVPEKQCKSDCDYAKMIDKSMCKIDWNNSAQQIHNQIRGLNSWPVAATTVDGKTLKIYSSVLCEKTGKANGELVDNKNFIVTCGDKKCLQILEVQQEGKKRMNAVDFLRGNQIETGTILGG